jgi:hypothetical protein
MAFALDFFQQDFLGTSSAIIWLVDESVICGDVHNFLIALFAS